jgi:hypothetical protein
VRAQRRASSKNAPIDLDRYAEILAHVRHFPHNKQAEVVARLGVPWREWEGARARWTVDMGAAAGEGRVDMIKQYSDTFTRTQRRLASLKPSLESLGPLPGPEAEEPPQAPVPEAPLPELASPAEPRVEVPSFMSNPLPAGPIRPGFMSAAAPATPDPVAVPAPAPVPLAPAAAPAPAAPAPRTRGRTLAVAAVPDPAAPQLPFKPAEGTADEAVQRAVAHAGAAQGEAPPRRVSLGETTDIGAIARGPLPFARSVRPIPEYAVERYASLQVELREYADRKEGVLARYTLDPETFAALDDDWKRRMNADSGLRSRFLDACERYRAWLRSRDAAGK